MSHTTRRLNDLEAQILAHAACFKLDTPIAREHLILTLRLPHHVGEIREAIDLALLQLRAIGLLEQPEQGLYRTNWASVQALVSYDKDALVTEHAINLVQRSLIAQVSTVVINNDLTQLRLLAPHVQFLADAALQGEEPERAGTLANAAGSAYALLGKYQLARQYLDAALALATELFGERDPLIGQILQNLLWVATEAGDTVALQGYQRHAEAYQAGMN